MRAVGLAPTYRLRQNLVLFCCVRVHGRVERRSKCVRVAFTLLFFEDYEEDTAD